MDGSFQHLNVGRGLDILLADADAASGSPHAVIHIQADDAENAVDIRDTAVAIRLTASRLRTLLGNVPMADDLLSRPSAHDGVHLLVRNSAMIRRIAQDIRHTSYSGTCLKLFLQGKVVELLVESLSQPEADGERSPALAIRDLLLIDPVNPPSMTELSRMLGLPQRRLSAAFKERFGLTVPAWLADWRLTRGHDLVVAGSIPMAEIAASLGYAHLSTFTAAFTKRFGVPPTRLRSGGTESSP
ncbi:MAG: helix-turn-helix transcriptional regulator [Alphaproteobacteria bacterium]|nr:helix-turn-helix transcriptional regulator [Alphaproteobacteria bacterium]